MLSEVVHRAKIYDAKAALAETSLGAASADAGAARGFAASALS